MSETDSYAKEAATAALRKRLSVGEVEPVVPGWQLHFIPSAGPLAGQPIVRTFSATPGSSNAYVTCRRVCIAKYGSATHILAGRSTDGAHSFGVWDV